MKIITKKCKICNYRMAKLYLRITKRPYQMPIVWYCKECDKLSDRIR